MGIGGWEGKVDGVGKEGPPEQGPTGKVQEHPFFPTTHFHSVRQNRPERGPLSSGAG